uniref:Integrase catalytic domain-containing protein n=1 Tax=Tanacetum cinerariifolium TaxID=118510 RepID=A0A6L2P5K6_TANCI|nr:hypothetical protein [Tanacetum cinerariifolium]
MPVTPDNAVARAANVCNVEMWETFNNLVISWIMSYVCESIAKSVMFIGTTSEIWSQLETRFSLSNGSRKYKLCKDMFGISQHGSFVKNAYVIIQQEESQKDVFNNGLPTIKTTTLLSKTGGKEKCTICGFKWHLPDKCWEKVSYPVWQHKYKNQVKYNQSKLNHKRTAASVKSGSNSFTFTSEQFENLIRNALKDMKPGETSGDCIDDELEFEGTCMGRKIGCMYHLLNVPIDQVDAKLRIEVEKSVNGSLFSCFAELKFDTKVKCIRSDNALKFVKGPCVVYLANQVIEHQTTYVDRPQQNGMVERKHRHILEAARALRISSSVLNNKIPYEKLLNKVPDYSNFRVFDSFDVASNPLRVVDKFSPKGRCIFHKHIFLFDESSSKSFFQPLPIVMPNHPVVYDNCKPVIDTNDDQVLLKETVIPNTPEVPSPTSSTSNTPEVSSSAIPTYSTTANTEPQIRNTLVTQKDPKGFKEAISDPGWCDAMNLRALEENGTWELIDLPSGKKAIRIHWIYKRKLKSDGYVDRKKARLVIQGNRQLKGVDYEETFAPVAKMGENVQDENFLSLKVCKLKKSLYGLKQTPRQWFAKLSSALLSFGYQQSKAYYSLFTKKNAEGCTAILLNVDDLMITGLEVTKPDLGLFISQKKYTLEMLHEAGVVNSRPCKLPTGPNLKLQADMGTLLQDPNVYTRYIGKLIYLTIT